MEIIFREMERRLAASKLLTREIAKQARFRLGLALGTSSQGWKAIERKGKEWKGMDKTGREIQQKWT